MDPAHPRNPSDAHAPLPANYTDLGDDRTIRFAGSCLICDARYATPAVRLPSGKDAAPALSPDVFQEERAEAYTLFDAAFRELGIPCPRCGRIGCPDCWDVDHHMCGACVAELGRDRSPHLGPSPRGPLADGRLERIEPGLYSDPARPTWLRELLDTKPALDPNRLPTHPDESPPPTTVPHTRPSSRPLAHPVAQPALVRAGTIAPGGLADNDALLPTGISIAPLPSTALAHAGYGTHGIGHPAIRATAIILLIFALLVVGVFVAAGISPRFDALVLRYLHLDPRAFFTLVTQLIHQFGRLLH